MIVNGANAAMIMNAGVYETFVICGINQLTIITPIAPIVPAKPARVPTDGPLNKSLESVCKLPMANWNPKRTRPTI